VPIAHPHRTVLSLPQGSANLYHARDHAYTHSQLITHMVWTLLDPLTKKHPHLLAGFQRFAPEGNRTSRRAENKENIIAIQKSVEEKKDEGKRRDL
jgi:hypothetical protein